MPTRLLSDLQTLRQDASEADTKYYERLLAKRYRDAYNTLEAQLAKLYAQMGDNPSLQEARRYGRLDKLRKSIADEYRSLTKYNIEITRQSSASSYADAYYGSSWAYDQSVGVELKWPVLSVEAIRASVWSGATGENFSERLRHWEAREVITLQGKITQGLALGYGYPKVAKTVKQEIADDFSRIMRIVRTEAHRNYSQGHLETYRQLDEVGVKARKQWVATLDTRTRDTHGALDGELADENGLFWIHGVSSEAPGLFGVAEEDINCRCRIVEVVEDFTPELRRIRGEGIVSYSTFKDWAEPRGWSESKGWPIEAKTKVSLEQTRSY